MTTSRADPVVFWACFERQFLGCLGAYRDHRMIRAAMDGSQVWIQWPRTPGLDEVIRAIPGVVLLEERQGTWYHLGSSLPAFLPHTIENWQPLSHWIHLQLPQAAKLVIGSYRRIAIRLVRHAEPRPTSALRTSLRELAEWAENVRSAEITALRGAYRGEQAWLFGERLPYLAGAERFWGNRILVPLGYRPDPDWPEEMLRTSAGVDSNEVLVLFPEHCEVLPDAVFTKLDRAMIRRVAATIRSPQETRTHR